MPKSKVMELAIKIAGKVDKSLGTSVKTSSKQLNTIIQAANKVSDVTTVGLAAMGTGAMAAAKYLTDLGGEWQKATNQVASSTGAAGAQLEKLRGVMETVYANNFGADVNDVAEAVALVDKNMASLARTAWSRPPRGPSPCGTPSATTWPNPPGPPRPSAKTLASRQKRPLT